MTGPRPDPSHTDRWLSVIAATVVAGVIITTVTLWVTAPHGPASFSVVTATTEQRVEVKVRNTGGTVATDVVVRATFDDGTETDQTISWLSPGETSSLDFYAPNPDTTVEVTIISYVPDN